LSRYYKIEECGLCGNLYSIGSFSNINAAGEQTYSEIIWNDAKINVCPKCTNKILFQKITVDKDM